jgi:hypothetical protein
MEITSHAILRSFVWWQSRIRFGAIEVFKLINKDLLERSDFGHDQLSIFEGLNSYR